jgi:phosphoglycerate kinase
MFTKKTIRDIDLDGKRVLMRADYNVPIENGRVTSDFRITQSLPTIKALLEKNVRLIICSHLGRPEGRPSRLPKF